MNRVRFVTHRNQRILLLDFTDCKAEEVATICDRVPEIVTGEPVGSVLVVADFSGAAFNRNAVERIKIATAIDRPHIKRAAWVLAGNLPRLFMNLSSAFPLASFPSSRPGKKPWTIW